MTLSFDAIPLTIRVPGAYIEFSNRGASRGLAEMPSRLLVFGQMLAAGTATPLAQVEVTRAENAEGLFGRGSMLHRMIRSLKRTNSYTETVVIPQLDAAAGVAAAGSITIGGAPSQAGTLNLYVGGVRVRVAVAAGESNTTTAAALATAIGQQTDLPVTAAQNGGAPAQVDITARHKGIAGNAIDLRVGFYAGETLPVGTTATIVAMSGGSGNPDIASAIAVMGDVWFTDVVTPWTDSANMVALETELLRRWGPLVQQDAFAYSAARGTHAQLTTLGAGRNSQLVSIVGADAAPSPPEEWAAAIGGLCAYQRSVDPARSVTGLPLTGIVGPVGADRFTWDERDLLLHRGIGSFRVDADGTVRTERLITTYQKNAFGAADDSYLEATTLWSLASIRYAFTTRIAQRFQRMKLAADETLAARGMNVATPRTIAGELIAVYADLIDAGRCQDMSGFKRDLIVEIAADDPNRVNARLAVRLLGNLYVFAAAVEFSFGTTA